MSILHIYFFLTFSARKSSLKMYRTSCTFPASCKRCCARRAYVRDISLFICISDASSPSLFFYSFYAILYLAHPPLCRRRFLGVSVAGNRRNRFFCPSPSRDILSLSIPLPPSPLFLSRYLFSHVFSLLFASGPLQTIGRGPPEGNG